MPSYSRTDDMLHGDVTVGANVDKQSYISAAADEIDSRIGYIYELPLKIEDLQPQAVLILKKINNFLASGRMIMALATGGEDNAVHAYGRSLVRDAYSELQLVLEGVLPLTGATYLEGAVGSRAPETINHDALSAVDMFEQEFYRVNTWDEGIRHDDEAIWIPGGG